GPLLADLPRERLYAILLDRRHRVLREHLVCEGTLDEAPAHPREVFIPALREGASAVIVLHNHPSGDPTPSQADYDVTARLALAGRALGVPLLDHVVIGGGAFVSIASEQGGSLDALCPADRPAPSVNEKPARYVARPGGCRGPEGISP
ncbi:MAG TPA: JAB domain-containing protein, partial [Planctomycetota bacterium]|nr:JAB domain-containing protein [Planctomycetota bacterium]